MWQRYNQNSHIFEKSVDNGVNWSPLPLNASILNEGSLPPALLGPVAYTNVSNVFTVDQWITTGYYPSLIISNQSAPADNHNWWIRNETGGNLSIQAINDASTIIQSIPLILLRSGTMVTPGIIVDNTNAPALTLREGANDFNIQHHTNFLRINTTMYGQVAYMDYAGNFTLSGALSVAGSIGGGALTCSTIVAASNIHTINAAFIYPGRVDIADGQIQGSWQLASHGAYGLYSNAGMYLAGGLWADNVTLRSGASITGACNVTGGITSGWGYNTRSGVYGPAGSNWFNFQWTGAIQCWIDASYFGDIAYASDARIKRDFTPLVNSLDKVLQMRPGTFYYLPVNDGVEADPNLHLGMLAQDMQSIAPEVVHNTGMTTPSTPDGSFRISYLEMIPILVAAIQELEQRVPRLSTGEAI